MLALAIYGLLPSATMVVATWAVMRLFLDRKLSDVGVGVVWIAVYLTTAALLMAAVGLWRSLFPVALWRAGLLTTAVVSILAGGVLGFRLQNEKRRRAGLDTGFLAGTPFDRKRGGASAAHRGTPPPA